MSVAIQCIGFDCPSFLIRPSNEGFDQQSSKKIIESIKAGIAGIWRSESMTFGRLLDETLISLLEVYKECSNEDWDGYGATAITEDAYKEARKIINLLPSSIKMPEIIAEPAGEIGFEWRKGKGNVFIISVGGKHRINYAGIFGGNKTHGSEYFEETIPSIIIERLSRLYS
jgi:hypothetical protein